MSSSSSTSGADSAAGEHSGTNPAWFSAIMGTAGTAAVLALDPLPSVDLAAISTSLAWILLGLSGIAFPILLAQFMRTSRTPWQDMASPQVGPAYATIPGAMLVLMVALSILLDLGTLPVWAWWLVLVWTAVGAILAVVVTVRLFVAAFADDSFPVQHLSGMWFVPETALMLAGIVLGRMAVSGLDEPINSLIFAAIALVGAGVLLFALTAAVFFTRLILHPHVRANGAPAMWIMLSPLSISILAMQQVSLEAEILNSEAGRESAAFLDLLAVLLWGFSLWWVLAAAAITWGSRAGAFTHSPADWSYVFPLAGLSLATIELSRLWDALPLQWLGATFAILLFAVWITVTTDTLRQRGRSRALATD
ncbi:MAG: hypothetical protein K0U60_05910 [Actinomycetia bacterium]|nr:hypothetical protein [Actinomycetes bacterium]MCH9800553.1 hypothetical protein [Actinomycetes bacterium]